MPLKGGGRESFPTPGTTAKTKNNLKTPSLFLLFPSLHFGVPFSLLRVPLPDLGEQDVYSRPGCGGDKAPWVGIGRIRVEVMGPVVGGRSSQRQVERDKWESKAEVSLQVLSSQSWNSSLYAVMRGGEGLSPGRGVGMMSKGLFEEDLLCSPRTTDEPAETDEAGKSGRMLL